jgi:hypothetical protein
MKWKKHQHKISQSIYLNLCVKYSRWIYMDNKDAARRVHFSYYSVFSFFLNKSKILLQHSKGLLRASSTVFTLLGILLVLSLTMYMSNYDAAFAQSLTPSSPSSGTVLPTIQITSPQAGQQVPPGELTIQGISSDDEVTDCRVYADVNDITPMQNVTAAGDSKKDTDFSKWSFAYTPQYQLIKQGENELTVKITCLDEISSNDAALLMMSTSAAPLTSSPPLSKWHTVNVTGVAGAPSVPLPSPSAENTEGIAGEAEENEVSEEEDIGVEEDIDSEEDSSNAEESTNDEQNDDGIDEDNGEDDIDNSGGSSDEANGDSFFDGDPFFE